MKMKNIILIIFTLIIGVAEAWGQTALPDASATLVSGTIYTATTKTIDGTLTVPTGGTVTIYIPAGVTLTINGANAGNGYSGINGDYDSRTAHTTNASSCNSSSTECAHNGNKEKACGGAGGTGAKPAIYVPTGATLIITGEGTLIAKGGNAGNGGYGGDAENAHSSLLNHYAGAGGAGGGGGGGAAAAIGGAGGNGGSGGYGGEYGDNVAMGVVGSGVGGAGGSATSGVSGTSMGEVWIVGNVTVNATSGTGSTGTTTNDGSTNNSTHTYNNNGIIGQGESGWIHYNQGGNNGIGGFQGSAATYAIGSGAKGGDGGNGGKGGDITWSSSPSANTPNDSQSYMAQGNVSNGNGNLYKQNTTLNSPNLGTSTYSTMTSISEVQMPDAIKTTFTMDYSEPQYTYYGTKNNIDITIPTKTGYTFKGYRSIADVTFGSTSAVLGDAYTIPSGTLYYDENGKFVAVSTDSNGNFLSLFSSPSTISLVAEWEANTYTVTLDKQDGTGGTNSVTATYDSAMPSASAPTRTGYTFGGYYSEANGGGTQYYNADMSSAHIWDVADNGTLYALWTANSYTVTLNAIGGTGGTASVTAIYDSAMPSATAPTGTGYNFLGYYYNDTQYYDENMNSVRAWDRAEATTLIAHWLPKQCTVILDADAVVTTPGTAYVNNVTYNQPMPTPEGLTAPTRTGYTFGGYYIGHNGSGTQYYTASMTSATNWLEDTESETTLYAKWTANQYTVSFNARGGSPTPGDITVTYDEEYGSLSTPTRYGFSFNGWYTGETSGTQVTSSTTVHITDDQTLYAHWNPITTDYDSYSVIGDPRLRGNYFRSFYDSHVAYELPDGVTAYKGQADGQYLVLTKIEVTDNNKNILPKDVPVILVAEPSYIDAKTEKGPEPTTGVSIKEISLTTSEYDVAYDGTTGNMLIGTDVDISVPDDSYLYYILSYGTVTKRLGFYKWPEGNTLSAHKAYVQQSPSSPAKALIFRFENEATGINDDAILDFADDASEPVIYNLNGIRLSKPQKGVNIINGKKVWVK